jgi:hypothetical protein
MSWKRLGWIDVPISRPLWWVSHAGFPTVVSVLGDEVLLFVSSRDAAQRSSCAYLKVKLLEDGVEIIEVGRTPLLTPGASGCFDESGVNVTFAEEDSGVITVWYHGWFLRRGGGWVNSIGCASGTLEKGLRRSSEAPVFDRDSEDPTSIGYPCWFDFPTGRALFYCSYESYGVPPLGQPYSYRVKLASGPGLSRKGSVPPHLAGAQAQSRPSVVRYKGKYMMFLCVKSDKYKICCAESLDGVSWSWSERKWFLPPAGLDGEVEETAYPHVIEHRGRLVMFYNGDGHGATGVGVASWDD